MASKVSEQTPLRWSLTMAAREFQVPFETVRRRLGETHQEPAADGTFTTRQLTTAIYGDLYRARLRTQNEQAEKLRLENSITTASVLDRAKLAEGFALIANAMTSRIMAAQVPRSVKEDLLKDLAGIPLVLEEVAHGQSRLRRGNGKQPEAADGEN
jgi:peroxiredoxin family protein